MLGSALRNRTWVARVSLPFARYQRIIPTMRFLAWWSGRLPLAVLCAAGLAIVSALVAGRAPRIGLGILGLAMAAALVAIAAWASPLIEDPWRLPRGRRRRR